MRRNPEFSKLHSVYLFPQIQERKREFLARYPQIQLISLGIGDTTQPLPPPIAEAMARKAKEFGTAVGYSGYGPEQGLTALREKIAATFYPLRISAEEIFISDGAKCDIGRLQLLFGRQVSVAIQDPSYPVYKDGSVLQGVATISSLPCMPENNFFPDLSSLPKTEILYLCSPNNPTGAAFTKPQLQELVAYAQKHQIIILYDTAYASYIQDPAIPRSIYEIEGANQVAIEVGSFSKMAGFSGIRLGWTVVPKTLVYEEGGSIWNDWNRLITTTFNGASLLAQYGGLAALENEGWTTLQNQRSFYLENARLLRTTLEESGLKVHGGIHAPYLWVQIPHKNSWEAFQFFLETCHLIVTPGIGFGSAGDAFVRISSFGHREAIVEACQRFRKFL